MLWHIGIFRLKFGFKPVLKSIVNYSCLKHKSSPTAVTENYER